MPKGTAGRKKEETSPPEVIHAKGEEHHATQYNISYSQRKTLATTSATDIDWKLTWSGTMRIVVNPWISPSDGGKRVHKLCLRNIIMQNVTAAPFFLSSPVAHESSANYKSFSAECIVTSFEVTENWQEKPATASTSRPHPSMDALAQPGNIVI
ncbi:uncharacterized protein LOC144767004 [Lissotriton helveticus]